MHAFFRKEVAYVVKITNKQDAERIIDHFPSLAQWDECGQKWFIACERVVYEGKDGCTLTIMRYPDGCFTAHCRGDDFCQPCETVLSRQEAIDIVWKYRAACGQACKSLVTV